MKFSMQTIGSVFNTNRMIEEYRRKFYIPTSIQHSKLVQNNFELANKKAQWLKNIYANWNNVKIILCSDNIPKEVKISTRGYYYG